jgi:Na+/proline symporter
VGLFGSSLFELGQNSIDQVISQRILCCKNYKEAQKAVNVSAIGVMSSWIMLAIGIILIAYYNINPLDTSIANQISAEPDRIFPYYIINELPEGLAGLLIAAIFAAGISTLDSALAALSQTTLGGLYQRIISGRTENHYVFISKLFIVGWALVITLMSIFFHSYLNEGLLNLGLKVPGFVYGALLGIALLALRKFGSSQSILWGTIVATVVIISLNYYRVSYFWWYPIGALVVIVVTYILDNKKFKIN